MCFCFHSYINSSYINSHNASKPILYFMSSGKSNEIFCIVFLKIVKSYHRYVDIKYSQFCTIYHYSHGVQMNTVFKKKHSRKIMRLWGASSLWTVTYQFCVAVFWIESNHSFWIMVLRLPLKSKSTKLSHGSQKFKSKIQI